ncbi:helicase-related protein [Sphingobium algorifonticola]|uniref:Helicase n=1 Tax=Sphingobium algorifonticola TaxID=2008318 RepID=A0A437J9I8_9SPHN|nr:helicase-related protein [Sphingobium algorifonticola]RVT42167.1 helicase [Sphingobium algorifonticola]
MAQFARSAVTAVLGPTNTGKTHLAVERLCGHSSGMMGFPLRLLAREVYDRVVTIKGRESVALITGEEKICPPKARYFLCTAESMPTDGDFAFVALDEAQLGADPERGHVFTDRLLRARGREETMILGSAIIAPLVRKLVPEAEIIGRPRFSTLSYAGAKKLSRLPKRSAIVAFSAEEVYAVAEMLRRFRGGAAVVMGALSPSTRNAQVKMFMEGQVDYLVATDAIGMGLNLDVSHVAFAVLRKFDGHRTRRLSITEMAQIAGRAGRHHRDGTFGSLGGEGSDAAFTPEEIEAIEAHRFPPLDMLYWRDGAPRCDTLDGLIADLEARPEAPQLRAAHEAVDLAVLKRMADDPLVRERARNRQQVARLWSACGLPDFQKLGSDHHARMVARLWRFLSEGKGYIPRDWFAQHLARLDSVVGDIDTLSGRIAAVRTWAYIAHRPDWLEHPAEMAERTRALEEKLSDALHAALRQRFVDRRTAVLLRDIGQNITQLPVTIDGNGAVSVDGESIGRLDGFRFSVDPDARGGDRRMLLAAAEKRLGAILRVKADELLAAEDAAFLLAPGAAEAPALFWNGTAIATLHAGPTLTAPEIRLDRALQGLGQDIQKRVSERLSAWMAAQQERHILPLVRMAAAAIDPETPAVVRGFFAQLADAGGISARIDLDPALAPLDKTERYRIRRAGITIGVLDIFHPGLLKPGAALWRMALGCARRGTPMLPLPAAGATLLVIDDAQAQAGARQSGFRDFGGQHVRIDMAERMACAAHETIAKGEPFVAADPRIVSLGLHEPGFLDLMREAGFRAVDAAEGGPNWVFRGRQKARAHQQGPRAGGKAERSRTDRKSADRKGGTGAPDAAAPPSPPSASAPSPSAASPFAGLADLLGRNG